MSTLGDDLIQAMTEALSHAKGEIRSTIGGWVTTDAMGGGRNPVRQYCRLHRSRHHKRSRDMTAPDKIWLYASALNNPSLITCGDTEYARITPGTITLPRAEVEDITDTLSLVSDWMEKVVKDRRIIGPEFHIPTLRKALATLQERMK